MAIRELFEDYKAVNVGKSICIELEVAETDARDLQLEFPNTAVHMESSRIYELTKVHLLKGSERKKIYDRMRDTYRNKFPVGRDTYLSWGIHFHAFFKRPVSKTVLAKNHLLLSYNNIVQNYHSCPLFCKVENFKFIHRPNAFPSKQTYDIPDFSSLGRIFDQRWTIGGVRASFRTHHKSYSEGMSIEFRCNDVMDTRIYWYYIGQMLLAEAGITLPTLSVIPTRYTLSLDSTYQDLSKCDGHRYNQEDQTKIKNNLNIILKLLRHNGFPNAAIQLKAYAKDVAIL